MTATPVPDVTLSAAYDECERVTRQQARNFSYGIRLLAGPKRRALSAVYAMARRIDDIGDGDLPSGRRLAELDAMRARLREVARGEYAGDDPVALALAASAVEFPIPVAAFEELVDGCEADVHGVTYATYDDLVRYCRQVAGSIGRLSLGVFGARMTVANGEPAEELADTLGIALQITNILRDIVEDRGNGRVYLPAEDLDRFGCTLDPAADDPQRFAELVRFEARRAEENYAIGLRLLPLLEHRSASCVAAMAGIYHRLLRRIESDPTSVLRTRVRLSGGEKARVATRALVWRKA